jgi:hypothetical protein
VTRLASRIKRLEEKLGVNRLARVICVTNFPLGGEDVETPYAVKVSSEHWAYAAGGPFTSDEIRELRESTKGRGGERTRRTIGTVRETDGS